MPRPPRLQLAGAIYHVTTRGNRGGAIYLDDRHCERFLSIATDVFAEQGWRCHAYCPMPNHYHLLVETPEADLSSGMQRLNSAYAHWFNAVHDLNGHLFERRFHAELVEGNGHLLEVVRYIVLNPVRAGLCRRATEWRWSSYLATVGRQRLPKLLTIGWLLSLFSANASRATERYAAFVEDAPARAP